MAGTPGHPKTGGRQKGTPNKRTAELDRLIAEARSGGKKPTHNSLDEMRSLAVTMRGLAATKLDEATEKIKVKDAETGQETERTAIKPDADLKLLAELMDRASRAWERVANFEHARKAAVHHMIDPLDLSKFTREQLVQLDGILAILNPNDPGLGPVEDQGTRH